MTFLLIVCQFCIINLHYQIWLTHSKVSLIYDYECLHFRSVAVQKFDSRCFFIADVLKLLKAVEWFIILLQIMHEILSNSLLQAYQDWIKLVSVFSSDLTQSLFSFINISLFNIIFLSTLHSTHVTNTFSSSLAQSLNIT